MDLKVSEILNTRMEEIKNTNKVERTEEFTFTLNKIGNTNLSERLNKLVGDISAQGKKLSDNLDISDMKKYRKLISEFMEEVSSNSHNYNRENFLDKRGRHRVYGIVRKVDENLDRLAEELLKSEKDNLKILERTNEIQGLLLDIMV
ncbi:MAG: YaaR family protein [Lachnospirales bacterium]